MTPVARNSGDILRQLVNTGSGGVRHTRHLEGKVKASVDGEGGLSRLTEALVTSSNLCSDQAAYITRLQRELANEKHTNSVLRGSTRRKRKTEDPNQRAHCAMDAQYRSTGMSFAPADPEAYSQALRLATALMDQ